MSMITTTMAAGLLRVTPSWFGRTMRHFGLQSAGRRFSGGQPEKCWTKTQVLGAMLTPVLIRNGASEQWADLFPKLLSDAYGDEQLEAAMILQGRKYVLVAGSNIIPQLLTIPEAEALLDENRATITALRIPTTLVDISEAFNDLMAAVREARIEHEELA